MDTAAIRDRLLEITPRLRQDYGAKRFWIFGSRARGDQRPESDVDLLVEFEPTGLSLLDFVGMEQEISGHLGMKVDLVDIEALREELRPHVMPEAIAV